MKEKKDKDGNNSCIREFDPQIYPCRLWVAKVKDIDMAMLDDTFTGIGKDDRSDHYPMKDWFHLPSSYTRATTYPVWNRRTGWYGCLILLNTRNNGGDISPGVVAHEASHYVHLMFDQLGIGYPTYQNDEPWVYFVQWATDRIWEVLKEKSITEKKKNNRSKKS